MSLKADGQAAVRAASVLHRHARALEPVDVSTETAAWIEEEVAPGLAERVGETKARDLVERLLQPEEVEGGRRPTQEMVEAAEAFWGDADRAGLSDQLGFLADCVSSIGRGLQEEDRLQHIDNDDLVWATIELSRIAALRRELRGTAVDDVITDELLDSMRAPFTEAAREEVERLLRILHGGRPISADAEETVTTVLRGVAGDQAREQVGVFEAARDRFVDPESGRLDAGAVAAALDAAAWLRDNTKDPRFSTVVNQLQNLVDKAAAFPGLVVPLPEPQS